MKNLKRVRMFIFTLVVTVVLAAALPVFAADGGALEASPYNLILSWTGSTATSRTVTWHEAAGSTGQYVEFDVSPNFGGSKKAAAKQVEILANITLSDSVYSAELTGLKPETTYWYRAGSSAGVSESHSFTTAGEASSDGTLSFMYLGDIQYSDSLEEEYAAWGDLIEGAYLRNGDIAFGMIGGDIVQSGIKEKEWNTFLKEASPVFSEISLMPVNGNHESNFMTGKPQLYLDMMTLPQNGPKGFEEEFYSFDYENCHITALNSWIFSGEQRLDDADLQEITEWVEDDLSSSSATWKIVVMHNPVYALESDDVSDEVKKNWEPVFEKCGVNLVFVGHQHVYSRSYPMADGKVDNENGIVYIMGNSGQKFYSTADEKYSESIIYNVPTYQIVRISGDSLTVSTEDGQGSCVDSVSLVSKKSNVPGAVQKPDGSNAAEGAGGSGISDVMKSAINKAAAGMISALKAER